MMRTLLFLGLIGIVGCIAKDADQSVTRVTDSDSGGLVAPQAGTANLAALVEAVELAGVNYRSDVPWKVVILVLGVVFMLLMVIWRIVQLSHERETMRITYDRENHDS